MPTKLGAWRLMILPVRLVFCNVPPRLRAAAELYSLGVCIPPVPVTSKEPDSVEVAVEVTVSLPLDRISPPVTLSPEAVVIPPVPLMLMPPSKDEVALPLL